VKRWNGWGSDRVDFPIKVTARNYLSREIGEAVPGPSARFEDVLASVPPSRLSSHPLISRDPCLRLRHARGQSLPDWISLRFGTVDLFPDGVARPASEEDVKGLISFARETGAILIPYGGGTSVVGQINPPASDRPAITVDMGRMFKMTQLDERSHLATFGAGVTGPHLEAQLRAHGFTLGHFPQSFEYSTLGGWIATRSSGQQALYYGRIEDLFAGGRIITPEGVLELPPFPASAAGPDLRQVVLGSEGRLGIITQATVRITPLAEKERFHAIFFPDWNHGVEAIKQMAQNSLPLSMIRLSDATETKTTIILAGREKLTKAFDRLLQARGLGYEKCLLLIGLTETNALARKALSLALDVARSYNGVHVGRILGNEWRKSRFHTPYLRNTLWDLGYAVDTLETAFIWKSLPAAQEAILQSLRKGLEPWGENVLAFSHISNVYKSGANLYFTYIFRVAKSAEETLSHWKVLKDAASRMILAHGGTISHQHGVGTDHLFYLKQEKGKLGIASLKSIFQTLDPTGIMNPGKLIDGRKEKNGMAR